MGNCNFWVLIYILHLLSKAIADSQYCCWFYTLINNLSWSQLCFILYCSQGIYFTNRFLNKILLFNYFQCVHLNCPQLDEKFDTIVCNGFTCKFSVVSTSSSHHHLRSIRFYLTFLAKISYSHGTILWQVINILGLFFIAASLALKFEKGKSSIAKINLKLGAVRFHLQKTNQCWECKLEDQSGCSYHMTSLLCGWLKELKRW